MLRCARLIIPAALAAALLGLGACRAYRPPALTVRDAAVTQSSEDALVIRFTLDAENTNDLELPLKGITYRLLLDGREVFRGVRSPEATLRRLGTQPITLPAVIPREPGAPSLEPPVRYRLAGTLTYVTPGSVAQILFDAGVRRPKVRFSESGTLDLDTETAPAG